MRLELTTSRLTVERASQLRHRRSIDADDSALSNLESQSSHHDSFTIVIQPSSHPRTALLATPLHARNLTHFVFIE